MNQLTNIGKDICKDIKIQLGTGCVIIKDEDGKTKYGFNGSHIIPIYNYLTQKVGIDASKILK